MRDYYDFDYSKAVWGRTAKRLAREGYPVMMILRPEVAEVFEDQGAVKMPSLISPANATNKSKQLAMKG